MALCDILIDANIQASCENPMFGGYEQLGWIINKSDVATTTIEEGVVSAISLKEGAKAYQIQSMGGQPTPTTQTFVKGNFANKWNNVVTMTLLDNGVEAYNNVIKPMASGAKFVVILEHSRRNADGTPLFEVFGLSKGLTLQDGASREEYNEDLGGGWNLPLEENGAPTPSYFITDKSLVEGLETPAV